MYKTMSTLFKNTERTIYQWKKENRPIIKLIEKYFTKEDLEEFIKHGYISKIENIKSLNELNVILQENIIEKLNHINIWNEKSLINFLYENKETLQISIKSNIRINIKTYLLKYLEKENFITYMKKDESILEFYKKFSNYDNYEEKLKALWIDLEQYLRSINKSSVVYNQKKNYLVYRNYIVSEGGVFLTTNVVSTFTKSELYYFINNIDFFKDKIEEEINFLEFNFHNWIKQIIIEDF